MLICGYAVNFNSAAVAEVFSFFSFQNKEELVWAVGKVKKKKHYIWRRRNYYEGNFLVSSLGSAVT